MRCPTCGRDRAGVPSLYAECWLSLRSQPPCVADAHFWHAYPRTGGYTVRCYHCRYVAGLVPRPGLSEDASEGTAELLP